MAFNFPNNPAVGDTYSDAGKSYRWTGYAWVVVAAADVYGPVYISDSPPSNPLGGDLWYESDTGKLFVYYCDINSNQWVQVGGSSDLSTTDYLPLAGGTMSGQINFGALVATNLANPAVAQDAATKAYVDKHEPAIVSATPPTTDSNGNAIKQGDVWYDSVGGRSYVWYEDGTTNQWVDLAPEPPFNTTNAALNLVQTLTPANDDTAAAAAGVSIGQMYLIPGGTTFNSVRVRLT
jgi:hypothetical protein